MKAVIMTPQFNFMVCVPISLGAEKALRDLLVSMNSKPGMADPSNALVPFGQFDRLHFARFVILDDATLDDVNTAYGLPRVEYPLSLAFVLDFDGPVDEFLQQLVRDAGKGLRQIFAHCGLTHGDDVLKWMKQHAAKSAASYVNWVGRTMSQVREEGALRNYLCTYLRGAGAAVVATMPAEKVRQLLRDLVRQEQREGRLSLQKPDPTPLEWRVRKFVNLAAWVISFAIITLLAILLLPLAIVVAIVYLVLLRVRERTDKEIDERPSGIRAQKLAEIEDHDVTNQFSALGSWKPGWFRLLNISIGLAVINATTRHLFTRGHLGRVKTIHFARWVFLDDKRRVLFCSNYDGSLDSYMDDFINKVGFGLNLVFSNGIGYPRTNFLVLDGAKDEQKFKRYIRRHELPTEVWYNAHPGLTAVDLARNARIREGLERPYMNEEETRAWLRLF